jgi:hypothetical protein
MSAFRVTLYCLALCGVAGSSFAQTFQAQMTGEVRDASGATIPRAKLTATNIATNTSVITESNDQGIYRFLALPPGQYNVAAGATGFKTYEQGPITLQVNDNVTLNIAPQVGDASERVIVSAAAESLQTQTASVGQVVTTRTIEGLPLNVRDPLALIGLTFGRWFNTDVFRPAAPFTFGNIGPRSPDIRTDFTRNVDVVVGKRFPFTIADHTIEPQFRAECYNLFNTPQFAAPNGAVTSQQFGTVTRQANTSRQFQFGLKISF